MTPTSPGSANFAADLLDEGAGDLDSKTFHERLENHAIELGFQVGRDTFHGSLRALNEHRDEAFDLLRLALTKPRFDAEAVERVREQELSGLRRDTTNPNDLASRRWWQTAFPGHPYGRETKGTLETMPRITADDLRDYVRRVFARNELKVSIVGDVDEKTAGELIDRAFGGLPAKNDLKPVPDATPSGLGRRIVIDVDVPQAVVTFGGPGHRAQRSRIHGRLYRQSYSGRRQLLLAALQRGARETRACLRRVQQPGLVPPRRGRARRHRHARRSDGRRARRDRAGNQAHGRERPDAPRSLPRQSRFSRAPMRSRSTRPARSRPSSRRSRSTISASTISSAAAPHRCGHDRGCEESGTPPLRRGHAGNGRREAEGAGLERNYGIAVALFSAVAPCARLLGKYRHERRSIDRQCARGERRPARRRSRCAEGRSGARGRRA